MDNREDNERVDQRPSSDCEGLTMPSDETEVVEQVEAHLASIIAAVMASAGPHHLDVTQAKASLRAVIKPILLAAEARATERAARLIDAIRAEADERNWTASEAALAEYLATAIRSQPVEG